MPLSPLNYTDYDFDQLTLQLVNQLTANPNSPWIDTYRSSTGQMLIELYAYVANLILYYIERRAEESYIETAQLRSSVINLVRLLNYIPARVVSSTGQLNFYKNTLWAFDIIIPQYTECRTASGLQYLTTAQATLPAAYGIGPANYVSVAGTQGALAIVTFAASGTTSPAQEYQINDTQIENSSFPLTTDANTTLGVFVNGVQWKRVTSFTSSVSTDLQYMIRTELDETVTILFGNNVFGKAPSLGDQIIVKYIQSAGANGNVYEADKIVTIFSPLYDSNNTLVSDYVSVRNPGEANNGLFTGGSAAETTDEIRANAPNVFKTGDRAVTRSDFISIIDALPGVGNANVWGENEENPPNYTMFNRVKLCVLMETWAEPTSDFKTTIINPAITAKSMLTVKYEYVSPRIISVIPTATVRIHQGYTISQAQININSVLVSNFVLGETTSLGNATRISTIIQAVSALAEVAYLHMVLEVRTENMAPLGHGHPYETFPIAGPIRAGAARVFVGASDATAVQIGYDTGVGHFVVGALPPGVTFNGGTSVILYPALTAYIGLDVGLPVGWSVWVRYQQDNTSAGFQGDILVSKDEICQLYKAQGDLTIDFE